jgi:hypothetical protein
MKKQYDFSLRKTTSCGCHKRTERKMQVRDKGFFNDGKAESLLNTDFKEAPPH